MLPFSQQILAMLIAAAGPNAGNSPYSFEAVPDCGKDPETASCSVERVCDRSSDYRCGPPRWSPSRGAWARVETRETALRRYQTIAESIARTSFLLTRCRLPGEAVREDCELAPWPEGPESLAVAAATTAVWESGLREDIQGGYGPSGRGTTGEVCLIQVQPTEAANFASWIPKKQRQSLSTPERVAVAETLLGFTPQALDRCFEVGMRALARARASCRGKAGDWPFRMWSRYGTGKTCNAYGVADDFAGKRTRTYHKLRTLRSSIPADVQELLGLKKASTDQRVSTTIEP